MFGKILTKREVKLFLTFFIIYFYFVQWYGWNEESRFVLIKAVVDDNRFEIDSFHNQTGDRAFYNGHYYSDKDPGISLLATPVYYGWKFVYIFFPSEFKQKYSGNDRYVTEFQGSVPIVTFVDPGFFTFTSMILVTALTSSLFTALTTVLVYKFSDSFTKNESYKILTTLIYGVGTLAFPQALHFMGHAVGTFFIFLAFYLLFKTREEGPKNRLFILAGIFAGFATAVDHSIILVDVLLFIYTLTMRRHKFLVFFLVSLVGAAPLLLYNYTVFNSLLDFGGAHLDREIWRTARPEMGFPLFNSLPSYKPENVRVIQNSFQVFEPIKKIIEYFHFVPAPPNPYVALRLLFYPYRGIFFYSPILLLSLAGLIFMSKKYRPEAILIVSSLLLFTLALSMRTNWWGGYTFGNRHLLPVFPLLTIPMIFLFKKVGLKFILPLVFLSVFINFLGLQPAEDWAYDWTSMYVRGDWLEKQNSFQVMANPLVEHYWPKFLEHGPRSWIFESLVNGYVSMDIRVFTPSKGRDFPFSNFHVPFLCLLPVSVIIILIWGGEKFSKIRKFL